MKTAGQKLIMGLVAMNLCWSVQAVPILINYGLINADSLEDFQSLPAGDLTTQTNFNGFVYEETGVSSIVEAEFCDDIDPSDQCLLLQDTGSAGRFYNLNAMAFGLEIFSTESLTAVVSGNSGSVSFDISGGLFGFFDASGLIEIAINRRSDTGASSGAPPCRPVPFRPCDRNPNEAVIWGNNTTSFDNVITQANLTVNLPEPGSLAIALTALLGFGLTRRQRSRLVHDW